MFNQVKAVFEHMMDQYIINYVLDHQCIMKLYKHNKLYVKDTKNLTKLITVMIKFLSIKIYNHIINSH